MQKSRIILFCVLVSRALSAGEKTETFQTNTLDSIACSVQVPKDWTVYDRSIQTARTWIITPDDLNMAHYRTGVRIDVLSNAKINTGSIASKWVEDRIKSKSDSLPVLSVESGQTNEYFRVKRLVAKEVYSPGRTEYVTYRKIYSWYWNDQHDVVICMEAQTPERSWNSMAKNLERIGRLEFDVSAWKRKLTKIEE